MFNVLDDHLDLYFLSKGLPFFELKDKSKLSGKCVHIQVQLRWRPQFLPQPIGIIHRFMVLKIFWEISVKECFENLS